MAFGKNIGVKLAVVGYKYQRYNNSSCVENSVVDPDPDLVFLDHPDPDPGKYRIRILYPQKAPCNSKYLVK